MKNIFKTFLVILLSTIVFSCSDDYFDVNTPGNAVADNKKNLKDILGPAIFYTFEAQYTASTRVSQLNQYTSSALNSSVGIDNHYEESLDSFWSASYVKALGNLKEVEEKAIETNSSHYMGIVQILQAINYGLLTDLYGSIPFSEASLGLNNFAPKYDSQEDVYKGIDALLDKGIANLSAPNTSSFVPGVEDLVYKGNISKWIKVAYTFKARFALHLSKIDSQLAANKVVSYLAKGITSNADDFQLIYNKVQANPWYTNQQGLNTGNVSYLITKQFIGFMNGKTFPFNTVKMDPRMPLLVDIRKYPVIEGVVNPSDPDPSIPANYVGGDPGQGSKGTPAPNAKIGLFSYYSKIESPVVILSYSEAKLMEAEAQFILGGGNATSTGATMASYTAYLAAIAANMDKTGVVSSDKNAYLADTSIGKGAAALQLKDIMRQKMIVLYLNCETFNDYRRYDFSTSVFPGLKIPLAADPNNGGKWVRRFVYSINERNSNRENYEINFKSMITPVWWDK